MSSGPSRQLTPGLDLYRSTPEIPQADEAERTLLGAILLDNRLVWDAVDIVRATDFRSEGYRVVYRAMIALADRGSPIDPITLGAYLRTRTRDRAATQVDGTFIASLIDTIPRLDNIESYARLVTGASTERRLQVTGNSMMGLATDPDLDLDAKRDRAYRMLEDVFGTRNTDGVVTLSEALEEGMVDLTAYREQADRTRPLGLPTGMRSVDLLLGGLQRKLYTIAGRPGVGKSALLANWAAAVVLNDGRVAVFSTEMHRAEIAFRVVARFAGIDSTAFVRGRFSADQWQRLQSARQWAEQIGDRFLIDHGAAPSPMQIKAKCKTLMRQVGLDAVFIDYLQILSADQRTNGETERVTKISNGLKQCQQDLQLPVVVASQLSRNSASEKREPELTDLRQSGAIEQDCDVAAFLWAPDTGLSEEEQDEAQDRNDPVLVDLLVKKHRGGRKGRVHMSFNGARFEFTELRDGLVDEGRDGED